MGALDEASPVCPPNFQSEPTRQILKRSAVESTNKLATGNWQLATDFACSSKVKMEGGGRREQKNPWVF